MELGDLISDWYKCWCRCL